MRHGVPLWSSRLFWGLRASRSRDPRRSRETDKRGMTLFEVTVTVALTGIVAASLCFAFSKVRANAHCLQVTHHLKEIGKAIELYANKYKQYPSGAYPLRQAIAEFVEDIPALWADPADRTHKDIISSSYKGASFSQGLSANILGAPCGDMSYVVLSQNQQVKRYVLLQSPCPEGSDGGGGDTGWAEFAIYSFGGTITTHASVDITGAVMGYGSGGHETNFDMWANVDLAGDILLTGEITGAPSRVRQSSGVTKTHTTVPLLVVDTTPLAAKAIVPCIGGGAITGTTMPPGCDGCESDATTIDSVSGGLGDGKIHVFRNGLTIQGGALQGTGTIVVYGNLALECPIQGKFNILVLGGGALTAKSNVDNEGLIYTTGKAYFSAHVSNTGRTIGGVDGVELGGKAHCEFAMSNAPLQANPPPCNLYWAKE